MPAIRLTEAAKYSQGLSHQIAAWNWLQEQIPEATLAQFAEMFRASPPAKTQASPSPGLDWRTPTLAIIRQFEGCELTAYADPGSGGEPWTIGWGSTVYADGSPVREGDTISQATADQLLDRKIGEARAAVIRLLPMAAGWAAPQQAALISFTYNVGAGALEASTLRKRLMAGQDPSAVIREELPRWNKGGSGVMEGLVRRREAEVALFVGGATPPRAANPLPGFPFFPQQDNGPEGWRQCQTSAIAMCLAYMKVPGITDDTDYLKVVQRYGDTTVQQTHALALRALGVRARFRQNMTPGELQAEIRGGLPAAIGILHHGPVTAPTGGGHYVTVYGFDATHWHVMDPYGELDLVNGGWTNRTMHAGKAQRYSITNLNRRWLVDGPASGWGWVFS